MEKKNTVIWAPHTIAKQSRHYLGTRFRHQGRSKQNGMDCLGLIMAVAKDLALTSRTGEYLHKLDQTTYSKIPKGTMLHRQLHQHLIPTAMPNMQVGNIALMQYDKNPQHLGIIGQYPQQDNYSLIHAYAPARTVVEHHLNHEWKERIIQLFRVPTHPQALPEGIHEPSLKAHL